MQTLRAAVIGVGHLGRHHARNLARIEGVHLVAVCDPDPERGRAAAAACGAEWVGSVGDLPRDLHAVSIAAPTPMHHELARGFLAAGVHCMVEKPMCATLEQARDLARAADAAGALVQVGHIERFNPVFEHVPGDLRPRFMDLRRVAPYPNRSIDTDVIFDLMIHDIDLALLWAGAPVVEVSATGGAPVGPNEDWAACRLTFASGCVAHLLASRVAAEPVRRAVLQEARCTVEVDFAQRRVVQVDGARQVSEARGSDEEPLLRQLTDFVRCIREGRRPRVSHVEGLRAVEVATRVCEQVRVSRPGAGA